MFKWLEKWAIKRLLKRVAEKLPEAEGKLAQLWEEHSDEIFQKVVEAIKATIIKIIQKAIEKQKIKDSKN